MHPSRQEILAITRQFSYGWGVSPRRLKNLSIVSLGMTLLMLIFFFLTSSSLLMLYNSNVFKIFFLIAFAIIGCWTFYVWQAWRHWNMRLSESIGHISGEMLSWTSAYDSLRWGKELFVAIQVPDGIRIYRIPQEYAQLVQQRGTIINIEYHSGNDQVISVS